MTRLGIIGFGTITKASHLPAVAANPAFALTAIASPHSAIDVAGVRAFTDYKAMLDAGGLDAVAICTTTQTRFGIARDCLDAGVDVLLEKPPAATASAAAVLGRLAAARGRVLFAAWHARFAAGVEAARAALAGAHVAHVDIVWREDVRRWHPGQQWIWQAGGFGVFDPGINALSIVSHIVPQSLLLADATLEFPANRDAPIRAQGSFAEPGGGFDFDWHGDVAPEWTIRIASDGREVLLADGGARLTIDGVPVPTPPQDEYGGVYARFADLIARRESDLDLAPLQLAADAFLIGARTTGAPFVDDAAG